MVAGVGFEPTTFGLRARRATRLLHPAPLILRDLQLSCNRTRIRCPISAQNSGALTLKLLPYLFAGILLLLGSYMAFRGLSKKVRWRGRCPDFKRVGRSFGDAGRIPSRMTA